MKLYYYDHRNFGDALNPLLWKSLLPGVFDQDERTLFIGTGTLLHNGIPRKPRKLVFGTGVGYGSASPKVDERWKFYWVRGKGSARALGLADTAALSDGALLVRLLPLPPVSQEHPVAFMPHWRHQHYWDWSTICDALGWRYIDPCGEVEAVLDAIRSTRLLVTDALHGAIVADTFRVPWIPVTAYQHVLAFKWQDWCGSMGLEYKPVQLPSPMTVASLGARLRRTDTLKPDDPVGIALRPFVGMRNRRLVAQTRRTLAPLAAGSTACLSAETTLASLMEQMQERLKQFQRDRDKHLFDG